MNTIDNEEQYLCALTQVEVLMDAKPNTSQFDQLLELVDQIEQYEQIHHLIFNK